MLRVWFMYCMLYECRPTLFGIVLLFCLPLLFHFSYFSDARTWFTCHHSSPVPDPQSTVTTPCSLEKGLSLFSSVRVLSLVESGCDLCLCLVGELWQSSGLIMFGVAFFVV